MSDIETVNHIKISLGGTQGPMGITRSEFDALNKGGPAGVYANLAALQSAEDADKTRIYLTLDNNNWNYWNGSSWVSGGLYQAVEIKNGSITQEKTDFIELTGNLLNKGTIKENYTFNIIEGMYTETPAEDTFISDFIPVKENEVYRALIYAYAAFDSSKEFISGQKFENHPYNIITIPDNASYIKITAKTSIIDKIFIAKLSSKQNSTMYKLKNEDILNNISEKSITNNKLMLVKPPEINLYNNDNNLFQCDLDETGNIIFDANNLITDYSYLF